MQKTKEGLRELGFGFGLVSIHFLNGIGGNHKTCISSDMAEDKCY